MFRTLKELLYSFPVAAPATWSLVNYSKETKCRQTTTITQNPVTNVMML